MKTRLPLLLAVCLFLCAAPAFADDWPQWRGLDRTGKSKETGLLQTWPNGGPPLLWTYKDTGIGFTSPSIVGDRLYTLGSRGNTTYVIAVDVKTGKELWNAKLGPMFTFQGNTWGDGPRSSPTVDGPLLYVLGGYGDLACFEAAGGKEVWRTNLAKDHGGQMMSIWGYSESPLVDGDQLICTPGGPKGTFAAFDKKTGKPLWQTKELTDDATYASLVIANIGGVRQYVGMSYGQGGKGGSVVGIAPDGKLLWTASFFKSASDVMAPTPVVMDNLVYVTSEKVGCRLIEVTPQGGGKFMAANLYVNAKTQKSLKSVHGGVVLVGKEIYGHGERAGWVCQDLKTGKVLWDDNTKLECGSGSLIFADGRLYLFSDQGVAALLKPNPAMWDETARFELPEKSKVPMTRPTSIRAAIWTPPVVANGRLYLRDQELLFCYDIRAKK